MTLHQLFSWVDPFWGEGGYSPIKVTGAHRTFKGFKFVDWYRLGC